MMAERTYPNDFIDKVICGDCLEVMQMKQDEVHAEKSGDSE